MMTAGHQHQRRYRYVGAFAVAVVLRTCRDYIANLLDLDRLVSICQGGLYD